MLNQLPHLPGSSSSDPSSSSDGSSGGSSSSSSGGAVLELSEQAVLYLSHVFDIYDSTRSGVLSPMDLEHMFNRAPVPVYQVGGVWWSVGWVGVGGWRRVGWEGVGGWVEVGGDGWVEVGEWVGGGGWVGGWVEAWVGRVPGRDPGLSREGSELE